MPMRARVEEHTPLTFILCLMQEGRIWVKLALPSDSSDIRDIFLDPMSTKREISSEMQLILTQSLLDVVVSYQTPAP